MATKTWIGPLSGNQTWNTAGNWSGGIPVAGDDAVITGNFTGGLNITVSTTALPSLLSLTSGDTTATLYPVAIINNVGWNLGSGTVTITANSPAGTDVSDLYFQGSGAISGTAKIQKLGAASIVFNGSVANTFSGGIDIDAGGVYFANAANRIGTGPITMNGAGTEFANGGPSAFTVSNTFNINSSSVKINTIGVAALQALTLSGPFNINVANPTITNANSLTLSGPITGTAGFTRAGTGDLTLTNTGNTVSGAITIGSGISASNLYFGTFVSGTGSANVVPNITSLNVAARVWYNHYVGGASTFNNSITFTEGGAGFLGITGASTWSGAGIVFSAGQLVGLGPVTPAGDRGLLLFTNEGFRNALITVNDFPTSVTFSSGASVAATMNQTIAVASGAAGGTYTTKFFIDGGPNVANTWTTKIAANQTAAPLVFQGGVGRLTSASAQTTTFRVGGSNTQDNTISGPITEISGKAIAITKEDAGKWILSGNNTYTGATSISAGTLSAQNATALGGTSAGDVTQTGGTLDISGGVALNKTGRAFTLVSNAGANALTTTTGTNTLACAGITLNSTIIVDAAAGASLTVNNTAAMSGAFGITKNNSGEIGLGTFANTYTGAVTINAGTLTVGNLQIIGTASSLGTGALSSAIALTGTLKYAGTAPAGHSTNRSITFTGAAPALDASGSGAVTYSACTQAAGARTITLTGTSLAAVNNTFSATLADGTGAVGVAKTGSNKWILSGALNHTGTTSCAAGTLNLGSTNRSISSPIAVSGGVVENSTNTVATSGGVTMTGGTITAEITSTTAVTVNSGTTARLEPVNSANSYTGATAINAGAVLEVVTSVDPEAAGAGKVLGNSAVTVDGTLTTSANANQRGQMRYGGNLTFNSGAILRIGFAA